MTKMADDVNQQAEDTLNKTVKLTNESGNLKKELRNSIHEKVSELRNLIYIIKDNLNDKISENNLLQNEVKEMKKTLEAERTTQAEGQLATSMYNTQEPCRTGSWTGTPPSKGARNSTQKCFPAKREQVTNSQCEPKKMKQRKQ